MTTFYLKPESNIAEPEARRVDIVGARFDDGWDAPRGNKQQLVSAQGV